MLAIVETHPVQYHAPVYRALASLGAGEFSVRYGSDFSVAGYRDKEFGADFAWDTDLTTGYDCDFVRRVANGGAGTYEGLTGTCLHASLDQTNPGVLMALGYHHEFDRAALTWARKNERPLLLRAETSDAAKSRSWAMALLRDLMLRRLYGRTAAVCYVGQHSRRHYQRLGVPENHLFFSPYCVDASTFDLECNERTAEMRRQTREEFSIPADAAVLVFSGKLSARKGVDLIPKALQLLPDKLARKVHVLFLGDGAERENLRPLFSGSSASFAGFQNQRSLSRFYHAADALVLPSRQGETWGLVVNEAMLHGLPCLVSDRVGSHPDLVIPGRTGEVFPSDDAGQLAEAMIRLLPRLPDAGLSAACRQQVSLYSVEQAALGISEAWRHTFSEP